MIFFFHCKSFDIQINDVNFKDAVPIKPSHHLGEKILVSHEAGKDYKSADNDP